MATPRIVLTPTEEWILQSIRMAAGKNGATLADIVGTGDRINKAVFTPEELRNGLSRLLDVSFVAEQDGRWTVVPPGSPPIRREGGCPHSDEDIERAIRSYLGR